MLQKFIAFIFCWFIVQAHAQSARIEGLVKDANTQEPLVGAYVQLINTSFKTVTDLDGKYLILADPGTYQLEIKQAGYQTLQKYNLVLTSGSPFVLNIELAPESSNLEEIVVTDSKKNVRADATDMITPLSVQRLTTEEIKSNPGGNYDVSKVVQTLPGVGGSSGGAARNDIIIRGGAPNENVYYLDGIEIPVLNHFQTQGSSGGAQGIVNVSFIDELKLTSSAFDARYDNALASTFVIKQKDGNSSKISGNIRASFTESAFTLEGPVNKKSTFLASGRISYLDFLFQLIDLPIRPRYQDYQLKYTYNLSPKTTLSLIGIGSYDRFNFGSVRNSTPENEYFRRSLPFINQWSYTGGLSLKHLINKGYLLLAISRNEFDNQLDRFTDANYFDESARNFGLNSREIENKLRFSVNKYKNGWKYAYGVMGQYVTYRTSLYTLINEEIKDSIGNLLVPRNEIQFNSSLSFVRAGAFAQVSKSFLQEKLLISTGIRTDLNSFTTTGWDGINTLSPRISAAYTIATNMELTASVGRYTKLPSYTVLGYKDAANSFVNNTVSPIISTHYVAGFQYLPKPSLRFTLEGFYKSYSNYPVSVSTGISLANQGQEFGAVGNEKVQSTGKGEAYGFELFAQQKLTKKVFYFVSYTFVRSLFSGIDGVLRPSAWDNRHLLSGTLGYKFGKNWQLGLKYRFSGGAPYTPFDLTLSQQNYAVIGTGTLDYSRVNAERLKEFQQLDLRIDKTWNKNKTSWIFFIDIQNLTASKQQGTPYYTFKRTADNLSFETTDGKALQKNGANGIPVLLNNEGATVTPTIGLIFNF